jgi:hypothetical protein
MEKFHFRDTQKASSKEKWYIALIATYAAPIAIAIFFVKNFGVNVPHWDQWALIDFFLKIQNFSVSFQDFFAQHNEHRILFPRIIIAILAFLSGWNNKLEMYFSLLLGVISFGLLYLIALKGFYQNKYKHLLLFHTSNILCCFIFFSLVQQENYLWGFQITWFLINFCLISAIACLVFMEEKKFHIAFIWAGLFCLIASFSSAHGLLTWLALLPLIIFSAGSLRDRALRTSLWISAFALAIVIYKIGYIKPENHPDTGFFIQQPVASIKYLLTLLGSLFWNAFLPRQWLGLLLLTNFSAFNIAFLRHPYSTFSHLIRPWLSIGWFTVLFAVITTVGRAGFGVDQAASSRYVSISILLLIALIQMWRIFFSYDERKSFGPMLGAFGAGALLSVQLSSNLQTIQYFENAFPIKAESKLCLQASRFLASIEPQNAFMDCLSTLSDPNYILSNLDNLEKLGFAGILKAQDITFDEDKNTLKGHIDSPDNSANPVVIPQDQSILSVTGWSVLENQERTPSIILLSFDDTNFFAPSKIMRQARPDVANALASNKAIQSGWQIEIDSQFIPQGESVLHIWVYDPKNKRFLALPSQLTLKK